MRPTYNLLDHIGFDMNKFLEDNIYSPRQLGEIMGIAPQTVHRYAKRRTIKREFYHTLKDKGYKVEQYLIKEG